MVKTNSICFITCVNNDYLYEICLKHIQSLFIPQDFEIEIMDIRDASSMASAYNASIKDSSSKYKVYLHQDTFILNRHFIFNLIELFQNNKQLGIVGVIGAEEVPSNGIWWEANNKAGKVIEYRNTFSYLKFSEVNAPCKIVKALDGLLLATQYDVPWREDIFDGWHLYDTSQCYEFEKQGYLAGIPYQENPWVIHACGNEFNQENYMHYIDKFIKTYLKK